MLIRDAHGKSHRNKRWRPGDYYALCASVLEPADGAAVVVENRHPDCPRPEVIDPFV
ncbi:MAG: hypothetical protein N2561_04555 [Bacteroidetes bacterium]|nr:hypothetical protein [Rhodothermia bacterium]MCX7906790.1 hypothetical protein [Bacteroidota bacterium]MDW8285199.1 hypothetical protein [Bacteroidota bacterium]